MINLKGIIFRFNNYIIICITIIFIYMFLVFIIIIFKIKFLSFIKFLIGLNKKKKIRLIIQ